MIIVRNKSVGIAKEKSELIHKKHVLIEAKGSNTWGLWVGLSFSESGVIDTEYDYLLAGEARFYGAEPQKHIEYLWLKSELGTQTYNYYASDGAISRPISKPLGHSSVLDEETGLKATTLTEALLVRGRGTLRGLSHIDPDNLAQDETLKLTIDGNVIFNITKDMANTWGVMNLVMTALLGAWWDGYANQDSVLGLPFLTYFKIEYLRASAGTAGISIRALYELGGAMYQA